MTRLPCQKTPPLKELAMEKTPPLLFILASRLLQGDLSQHREGKKNFRLKITSCLATHLLPPSLSLVSFNFTKSSACTIVGPLI